MLKKANLRVKNLYNHKCELHNCSCSILNKITNNITINKNSLHILDASDSNMKKVLDNLSPKLKYLEVFNLNFDLTNLPLGLKKLCVVSYKKFNIKVPFGCEFIERIMNYNPSKWVNNLGHGIIASASLEIGGTVIDKYSGDWTNMYNELKNEQIDLNSHTGKILDERTKLIYELVDY